MAGDFTAVKAELLRGVLNTHPNTSSLLADAMVRQLQALQPEAIPFMERSGQFTTIAGRAAYDAGTSGFPKSLLRFDRLYYDLGSTPLYIDVVDIEEVRLYQEQPSLVYPRRACWQGRQLQLGPAPAGAYPVKWDAVLDSTKDARTGRPITASSTVQSNPWFVEGAVAFKHLAWADYFATSPDQRPDLAEAHRGLAAGQLDRLRKAQAKQKQMNATPRAPNAFDMHVRRINERLQTYFPGARG